MPRILVLHKLDGEPLYVNPLQLTCFIFADSAYTDLQGTLIRLVDSSFVVRESCELIRRAFEISICERDRAGGEV